MEYTSEKLSQQPEPCPYGSIFAPMKLIRLAVPEHDGSFFRGIYEKQSKNNIYPYCFLCDSGDRSHRVKPVVTGFFSGCAVHDRDHDLDRRIQRDIRNDAGSKNVFHRRYFSRAQFCRVYFYEYRVISARRQHQRNRSHEEAEE